MYVASHVLENESQEPVRDSDSQNTSRDRHGTLVSGVGTFEYPLATREMQPNKKAGMSPIVAEHQKFHLYSHSLRAPRNPTQTMSSVEQPGLIGVDRKCYSLVYAGS
jgi:hypothetical protein